MRMLLTALFAFLVPISTVQAVTCAEEIRDERTLIAPVQPVESVTRVSDDILVLLVGGDPEIGDSVVPVRKKYSPEVHAALSTPNPSAWIGIREGVDGHGDPALWMSVWAETSSECVSEGVDDRVWYYRGNAPSVFWEKIYEWERTHPLSALRPPIR